jgi:hypothetical protein
MRLFEGADDSATEPTIAERMLKAFYSVVLPGKPTKYV